MLILHQITYAYGARALFAGVSATVPPGTLVHVQGPNGIGKSTLLSLVAGLRRPTQGRIYQENIGGTGISKATEKQFEKVSYLAAESNGHFEELSPLQNIRFWTQLMGKAISHDEILAELTAWGLSPWVTRHLCVYKLSTGMKRRLALARLSLLKTPLWVLDEPLFGLDQEGIERLRTLLVQHLEAQGTIFYVSHEALQLPYPKTLPINLAAYRPGVA